jgi:hypothetical protein
MKYVFLFGYITCLNVAAECEGSSCQEFPGGMFAARGPSRDKNLGSIVDKDWVKMGQVKQNS